MARPTLSLVIITFNEERNIRRCLESAADLAQEIIVVDSGSTDHTAEICASFNATFIHRDFTGHIEQKNYALSLATCDWVLSLDADEALSDALKSSIANALDQQQSDAYSFNRLTNYCGKWIRTCGWYPDTKTRLVKNKQAQWTGQNPHDRLQPNDGLKTQWLNGDLLHYSYYTMTEHVERSNKYSIIAANAMFAKGKKISLLMIFVKTRLRFFKCFILKRGFMDGIQGLMISNISANEVFLKYTRLYLMNKKSKANDSFFN